MADVITDITAYSNQALLDAAEWAGVTVWYVIASIAAVIIVLLLIAIYLMERRHDTPLDIYTDEGQLELVEKTIAEFPADRVRIEGKKGRVVIKLISEKPAVREEPLLPQEVKEGPKPAVVEKAKPPVSTKKEEKKEEPKSEPIAMGAVGQPPKKPEEKK